MCQYGEYGPYKRHYACLSCRKGFKWPLDARRGPPRDAVVEVKCPQCGEPMADMGLDFKPPRQRDLRQWRKVELLLQHGYDYRSCGCGGPGYRPRTLGEARRFVAKAPVALSRESLIARLLERTAS